MYWPDRDSGVDVEPARRPVVSAVRKYFTEGGPGTPPTVPGGDWFNQVTNELLNVLSAAGIVPSKTDDEQLLKAIKKIIFGEISSVYVDGLSGLQALESTNIGSFIQVDNQYGVDHGRILSDIDAGLGVLTAGGLYANLVVLDVDTIYMSQLFWPAESDQTSVITGALADFVDTYKIRSIVLDVGDVYLSTTLPPAFNNVVFSGLGKLLIGSVNNILQRVGTAPSPRQYHGDYNSSMIFGECFKNAVKKRKEVRIVLMGDSISVGPDYDTVSIPAGERESTGVDNDDRHNCLAATLFAEIVAMVPSDVRVRFYSRSIGGRVYLNINQSWDSLGGQWAGREAVTAGKAWRNCVLDLNPDLVIHSFGMNESPQTYYDGFLGNWHNYIKTASQMRSQSFDQAILTTPNPNFTTTTSYGDFRDYATNAAKFYIAGLQRLFSRRYGYALIDVAFNSTLKRYGFDPRSVTFEKPRAINFTDGTPSKTLSAGQATSTSGLTVSDLPIYTSTRFIISSLSASSASAFDFRFNAGSVVVELNAGSLIVFASVTTGSDLINERVIVSYVLPVGIQTEFVVTITPQSIYVYAAGALVATLHNPPITSTHSLLFDNSVNSYAVTVHSISVGSGLFPRYSQDSPTDRDFYGEQNYLNNPFGGGVNHPSSTMLNEIYIPPVREFLEKAMNSKSEHSTIIGGTSANEVVYIGRVLTKRYNKVRVYEYGSLRETIFTIASDGSATVLKNTGGNVQMYFDQTDGALFLKNTTEAVLQVDLGGEWINKNPVRTGLTTTPRGVLLATVV